MGELPAQRNELTLDIEESEDQVMTGLVEELGGGTEISQPSSPMNQAEVRTNVNKRKGQPQKGKPASKRMGTVSVEDDIVVEAVVSKKNSDIYPIEERPPMYRDEGKFNLLSQDRAAKICFKFYRMNEKKRDKERKQNSIEKCFKARQ